MGLKHDYEEIDLDCSCLSCVNASLSLENGKIRINCPNQEDEHDYEGLCQKHEDNR